MTGITFDTGALIALARRRRHRMREVLEHALAAIRGATLVDAIVMASAAARGDVVYSSDVEDLEKLRGRFPSVRVLRV